MSGSAASLSRKKNEKGQPKMMPDFEPNLRKESTFLQEGSGPRKEENKKGSTDVFGRPSGGGSSQREPMKKPHVRISL
jgi:hypothetical protein